MTTQLKLDAVEAAFSDWRANRKHRTEPVPSHLWSQVEALLPHYKRNTIKRRLKIKDRQIEKQLTRRKQRDEGLSHCHFVMATPSHPRQNSQTEQTLEVMMSGDSKKTITLKLSIHALQQLLPELLDHV